MRLRKLARSSALIAWLTLAAAACGGASFDDPSLIKGLRVIGVQKSTPYPTPDTDVEVKLLFWDAKSAEDNPRDVNVFFARELCTNPPGDLYYNCFSQLAGGVVPGTRDGGNPDDVPDADVGDGGEADGSAPDGGPARAASTTAGFLPIPRRPQPRLRSISPSDFIRATDAEASPRIADDVDHIRSRHYHIAPASEIIRSRTGTEPYGLAYVLFAVCPGRLGVVPNAPANALPLGCFDNIDNHQYGPDDFVLGYTAMYVYETRANANPVVNDFTLNHESIAGSTTDDTLIRHIPSCTASDRTTCPKIPIQLVIDKSSAEPDPSGKTPDGQDLEEQLWVAFYATGGEFKSSLRLVNDATEHWNEENGTEFTAPAEAGPVRLFAVVHDNRGGVTWAEAKIIVD